MQLAGLLANNKEDRASVGSMLARLRPEESIYRNGSPAKMRVGVCYNSRSGKAQRLPQCL